ncbi:MAG: hypothetical protein IPN76_07245 [Saprospiraceae bacterium]|nr:hypothetical protein [Saprospiraceae bacterium]
MLGGLFAQFFLEPFSTGQQWSVGLYQFFLFSLFVLKFSLSKDNDFPNAAACFSSPKSRRASGFRRYRRWAFHQGRGGGVWGSLGYLFKASAA